MGRLLASFYLIQKFGFFSRSIIDQKKQEKNEKSCCNFGIYFMRVHYSQPPILKLNKRSVLRRQSRDTNRNMKRLVPALPIRIVKSNVSSIGPTSERNLCNFSRRYVIFSQRDRSGFEFDGCHNQFGI